MLYVEPAKWVARLREVGADALLRSRWRPATAASPAGYSAWSERAFAYAWVIDAAGAHPSGE